MQYFTESEVQYFTESEVDESNSPVEADRLVFIISVLAVRELATH